MDKLRSNIPRVSCSIIHGRNYSVYEKILNLLYLYHLQAVVVTQLTLYSGYKKKLYPFKFKFSASYCIKLTALNASN